MEHLTYLLEALYTETDSTKRMKIEESLKIISNIEFSLVAGEPRNYLPMLLQIIAADPGVDVKSK